MQADLFTPHGSFRDPQPESQSGSMPLAARMRPESLEEVVGQQHLLAPGKLLRRAIETDRFSSLIFYGPPGVGKTTLAYVIARSTSSFFVMLNGVESNVSEIRDKIAEARTRMALHGQKTILFVDELHRFNKAQQDVLLPHLERGTVRFIGATTENPYFAINSAMLSRSQIFPLEQVSDTDIEALLKRALQDDKKGLGQTPTEVTDEALSHLALKADGDVRKALTALEVAVLSTPVADDGVVHVDLAVAEESIQKKAVKYDRTGDGHYDTISAFIKSMRGSDPDAAIYWMLRMLDGGEEPLYIARRLVRFASEDVGLADPNALPMAISVYQACHFLGMPECDVHLTHAVVYLSMAPKSNALYVACEDAKKDIHDKPAEPVPLQIRNAPTRLMKEADYGKGYQYAHDTAEKLTRMVCLPDSLRDRRYYLPTEQGREVRIKERLEEILAWKKGKG